MPLRLAPLPLEGRRWLAAAAVGLCVWATARGASPAEGDEAARMSLRYDVVAGCPTQDRFARELAYRTGKIALDGAAGEASRLEVRITQAGPRYSGRLVLSLGGAHEVRSVEGTRCESVVAALSLAAALLVDPAARTDPLPASLPGPPDGDAGLDASDAGAPARDAESEADVAAPPPPPSAPPVSPARPPAPPPPPAPVTRPSWSAEMGLGATSAIDTVDPWLAVGVELRSGWAARLLGLVSPGGDVSAPSGTIAYGAYAARLDLCPVTATAPRAGGLRVDACASGLLWVLPVRAPSAGIDRPQTRVLATPALLVRAGLPMGPVRLALDLGLGVHVAQERFRIEPSGEVFRVPRVYGFGGLGASMTIR